ncbi:MAG: starch synthase [Lentimonas sp.]|jgi:starch synthase
MVTPEVVPFVKVGGLADVVGALSKVLDACGHDVRLVVPKYAGMQHIENAKPLPEPLIVKLGGHDAYARVWECKLPGSKVICYLLEHDKYFDDPAVYGGGPSGDGHQDAYRFTFLSRAAVDLSAFLDWIPDLLHCHDWTTGLVPVYLNTTEFNEPIGRAATLLTLHNMGHQGRFHSDLLHFAGLPDSIFRPDGLESMGQVNLLKGGIYHATKLSTVSPTYAHEIQAPENGGGLDHVLRFRAADLMGILNGIDESEWNSVTDSLLPAQYSAKDLAGKSVCKVALQKSFGLEVDDTIPIFSVVARLFGQKGIDLLAAIADRLMTNMQIQIAVLGTGEAWLESVLSNLAERYPGRFAVHIGFNHKLSHLTAAGSDFLVMPSRYEPCGLSQMYAMKYGTLPIVRATGGLKDSVDQYVEGEASGTGFLFEQASPDALYYAIGWACSTYYDRRDEYKKIQQNAMLRDFSWEVSAKTYESLYKWAIDTRRNAFDD